MSGRRDGECYMTRATSRLELAQTDAPRAQEMVERRLLINLDSKSNRKIVFIKNLRLK